MPHILSISYDVMLLNTRQLMLEGCGYSVTSAEGYVEAITKCRAADYDLLILGHSIPYSDNEEIVREFQARCQSPILALIRENEPELESATNCIHASNPKLLLDTVARLLARRAGAS
jgi:CheY-like chemotaxis protein